MKSKFHFFTLICLLTTLSVCKSAYAQAPVYEQFDVDSVAVPRGGPAMLETFISVNLRKPFMAQVANATGRVFVKAVVEPTGYVSDVALVRGFRPDCNAEALRVISLFNAWKPAMKGGQAVRQTITYPVIFRANEPLVYQDGQLLTYFTDQFSPVADAVVASYLQTVLTDTLTGIPSGDMVFYEFKKGKRGNEVNRFPLVRKEIKSEKPGNKPTYQVGHKHEASGWIGLVYTLTADGSLLAIAPVDSKTGQTITYDTNGRVKSIDDRTRKTSTSWFSTGLLKGIVVADSSTTAWKSSINWYRLMSSWDSTGVQQVKNGNGQFNRSETATSRDGTGKTVQFVETGNYVDGLKDGIWTGAYTDGSYKYEESFDHGKGLGGTAILNGTQTINYAESEQNPAFKGGSKDMYAFLSKNISYPSLAAKNGIQGKVYVAFTVCADGTLCDYDVLKGVHPSLDTEALRVIQKMSGQWQPGYQRGEAVRVKYNMPISFQFQ